MKKTLLLSLVILCSFIGSAHNLSVAKDQYNKGNEAYMKGDYESALNHYLVAEPHTEGFAINYNLGNAYFKLGEIPESILHYERALRFEPSNEDALYNLSLANDLIVDKIEVLPKSKLNIWWRTFRYGLGPDGWAKLCILLSIVGISLLLLFYLSGAVTWRRLGFFGGIFALIFGVLAYTLAVSAENFRYGEKAAVVFTDKVDVKGEPRGGSLNVFVLHAGTKVDLLNTEGEWFEVRIASGARGWIHSNDLRVV